MIRHILANGAEVTDLAGHLVRRDECPAVYDLIAVIMERRWNGDRAEDL